MSELSENLDATIAEAVKAQVSAKVLEALSGDAFMSRWVTSILQQPVEISADSSGYRKTKISYVDNVIRQVMQKAVAAAVSQAVEEERETIQDEVRKAVKRRSADIAVVMTDELLKSAENGWRFNVQLYKPKRDSE